jgi:hypothetical protein
MGRKLRIEEFDHPSLGRSKRFVDSWRGHKAICFLFGEGPGPEGELVRLIGTPSRQTGFDVYLVKSYVPRMGHAKAAYEFIFDTYGAITAREITSSEGLALNLSMQKLGLVVSLDVEDCVSEQVRLSLG